MRLAIVIIYLAIMIYFIFNGLGAVYIPMAVIAAIFIFSLPVYKKHVIQTTRKKIIEAQKMKQEGKEVKPFIEINSSPWYYESNGKNGGRIKKRKRSVPFH